MLCLSCSSTLPKLCLHCNSALLKLCILYSSALPKLYLYCNSALPKLCLHYSSVLPRLYPQGLNNTSRRCQLHFPTRTKTMHLRGVSFNALREPNTMPLCGASFNALQGSNTMHLCDASFIAQKAQYYAPLQCLLHCLKRPRQCTSTVPTLMSHKG